MLHGMLHTSVVPQACAMAAFFRSITDRLLPIIQVPPSNADYHARFGSGPSGIEPYLQWTGMTLNISGQRCLRRQLELKHQRSSGCKPGVCEAGCLVWLLKAA